VDIPRAAGPLVHCRTNRMKLRTPPWRRLATSVLLLACASLAAAQTNADVLVVEEIRCAGNAQTSCGFIRDHLYLKAGEPLDEEQVRNAELRLRALRNFAEVNIHLEKGAARGAVVVVIEVEEASPVAMEWQLGASSRLGAERGVFAARIGHENLFGKGKIVDVSAVALVPVSGATFNEAYDVALRYADPQLADSKRWFGVASARWRKRRYEDRYGNFGSLDTTQLELSVGRRIADFSYLTYTITFRPDNDWFAGRWRSDGTFVVTRPESFGTRAGKLVYGWSTEDDLHFPTQGSTLQITAGGDYEPSAPAGRQHLQFRKTWAAADAYWTVKVGGDPTPEYRSSFGEGQLFAMGYARPVAPGDEIRRGRWYVEPGLALKAYTSSGSILYEYGLKAGFRADTRTFGIVDLYLFGTRESVQ
jgi:outer membrane protein assembly factor BamA